MDQKTFILLSYNISYQSTYGVSVGSVYVKCPRSNDTDQDTVCLNRIIDIIDSVGPFDFITLIEAAIWPRMKAISTVLHEMDQISHKSGKDVIVLFYHKKYILSSYIFTEFSKGRPILITFFNDLNLCIISIHAGHNRSVFSLSNRIMQYIIENKIDDAQKKILERGHIVIMGDFNSDFFIKTLRLTVLSNRRLYGVSKEPTCCIGDLGLNRNNISKNIHMNYDQIISSSPHIITDVITSEYIKNIHTHFGITMIDKKQIDYPEFTSDHLPIIAKIILTDQIEYEHDDIYFYKYLKYRSKYIHLKKKLIQ